MDNLHTKIVLQTVEMISSLMGELESKAFSAQGFSDITMRQMLYLETISLLDQPSFSELADHLQVTRPSVSGIVHRLIESGYITKHRSEEDGRVYHLKLTQKGEKFNRLHHQVHRELALRITSNLTGDEISALADLLEKISPDDS